MEQAVPWPLEGRDEITSRSNLRLHNVGLPNEKIGHRME